MQIFKNAEFVSCATDNRVFDILVEDGGRIRHTGDTVPDAFSDADSVDLGGGCVVPAFGDTHIHFTSFALFNAGLDVRRAKNFADIGALVAAYIRANPKEKVILGFGCSGHTLVEKRLPEREDLDKFTSKPLMLIKYDGHAAVANSSLIRKLPSRLRKVNGFEEQTGWFFLDAFYQVVNHITRSVPLPKVLKNLSQASHAMAQKGIGLIHTVEGVGFPLDLDVDLMRLAAPGLPQEFRVYFQTLNIAKVLFRGLPRIGGCFATALDGCFGSQDAALRAPYQNDPGNRGTLFYTQTQIDTFVRKAHGRGLQIAMHAIGDAAVEQALIAFEKATTARPWDDHRHTLIHADLMPPEFISRASDLGVCIALQPPFLCWDLEPMTYLESLLGPRIQHLIPLKSLVDAGITVAGGSDAPCTLPDPILGIHAACNHPNPAQSVSALEALRMHTINCARLSFDEDRRGTLEEGKLADFVVLDQNPLAIEAHRIKEIQVQALYIEGRQYAPRLRGALALLAKAAGRKFGHQARS